MKTECFLKLLILCLVSISSGCSHRTISLKTIYSSHNCAISEAMTKSIHTHQELDHLLKLIRPKFSPTPPLREPVDFNRQTLILLALGQKTSAGYAIKLDKNEAILKGQKLYLPVTIQQPDKKRFQAQVLTSPCHLFAVPKSEFREIHIVNDQMY